MFDYFQDNDLAFRQDEFMNWVGVWADRLVESQCLAWRSGMVLRCMT